MKEKVNKTLQNRQTELSFILPRSLLTRLIFCKREKKKMKQTYS